ncbi:MAG: hypothetical protein Q4D38_14805 [Planctomycetia bacterium]|nr:hypothetical protein [Planctomycetia bacterium]
MYSDADIDKICDRLRRKLKEKNAYERGLILRSYDSFKRWAGKVLKKIGVFIGDVIDAFVDALSTLWEGLKAAFGY